MKRVGTASERHSQFHLTIWRRKKYTSTRQNELSDYTANEPLNNDQVETFPMTTSQFLLLLPLELVVGAPLRPTYNAMYH
jgi:hypothetical protein